ncbi:MAG: lysophospholipid acyltransferase family protein [Methylococcales bacterium]
MSWVARVEVIGAQHLQSPKGKIVVSNHIGWADPLWMGYAAYPVFLQQMAKRELFINPFMRWFVSSGGGFPVDRNRTSPATIKHTITLLEKGGTVLIFPQGTRSHGESGVKRGAATIALHAGVDIIPAHYAGPEAIEFRHLFSRPRIRIVFGAPITVQQGEVDKLAAIQLTQQIDAAIKAIS